MWPPKGNFLCKNMSHDSPFNQPPKSYDLQCFSIGQTAQKSAPSQGGIYTPCNIFSLDPLDLASQTVQPFL